MRHERSRKIHGCLRALPPSPRQGESLPLDPARIARSRESVLPAKEDLARCQASLPLAIGGCRGELHPCRGVGGGAPDWSFDFFTASLAWCASLVLLALAAFEGGNVAIQARLDWPAGFSADSWSGPVPTAFPVPGARPPLLAKPRPGAAIVPAFWHVSLTPEVLSVARAARLTLRAVSSGDHPGGVLELALGRPAIRVRVLTDAPGSFDVQVPQGLELGPPRAVPAPPSSAAPGERTVSVDWSGKRLRVFSGGASWEAATPANWRLDSLDLSSVVCDHALECLRIDSQLPSAPGAWSTREFLFEPEGLSAGSHALTAAGLLGALLAVWLGLRALGRLAAARTARREGRVGPLGAAPRGALRLACVLAAGVAVASSTTGAGEVGLLARWVTSFVVVVLAGLAALAVLYRAALLGRPVFAGTSDNLQLAVLALWTAAPAWGLWHVWALAHRVPELLDVALAVGAAAAASFPPVLVWGGRGRARGVVFWSAIAALPMAAGWLSSRCWPPESDAPGLALLAGLTLGAVLQGLLLLVHQDGLRPVGVLLLGPILALTVAGEVYTKRFVGPVMLVGGYYPYYVWMQPESVDDPVDLQHVRPFRGRTPGPRRPEVFRVVVLGASATYGLGMPADSVEDYPSLMAPLLSECAGGRPVECINAGVPGFTSELGLELFRQRLVGLLPDLVIVCFGTNDQADDCAGPGLDRRLLEQERKLAATPALLTLRSMARRSGLYLTLARAAITGQVADVAGLRYGQPFGFGGLTLPRVTRAEYLENLESFIDLSKRQGFRLALTSDVYAEDLAKPCGSPGAENWAGGWVPLARNLAQTRGVTWLEARKAFCDPSIPAEKLFFDGVHLTADGHRALARELARQLCAAGLLGAAPRPGAGR